MDKVLSCNCCWIKLRRVTLTIFLLCINIIFYCLAVGFSLFCCDELSMKLFLNDEFEMSMAYVFVLIEVVVFFSAIVSAFRRKSSMLTFATVMLLLESFFIISIAVRVHYNRKNFRDIWEWIFVSVVSHLPNGKLKEFLNVHEQSTYFSSAIIFYSMFVLVLIFKLCCAMVVNNFKNDLETIRIENILRQLVCGSRKTYSSRPTSYDISEAIADIVNEPYY